MFASSLKEDKGPLLSEGRKTELWYHLGQTADRVTSGTDWHSGRNGGNGPQRGTPPAEMYWCDWSHNPSFLLMLHLVLSAWLLLSSLSDPKNYLFCLLSHCCSFYCFWTLFLFLLLVFAVAISTYLDFSQHCKISSPLRYSCISCVSQHRSELYPKPRDFKTQNQSLTKGILHETNPCLCLQSHLCLN